MRYSKKSFLVLMMQLVALTLSNASLFIHNYSYDDHDEILAQPVFDILEPDMLNLTTTGSTVANYTFEQNFRRVEATVSAGFTYDFI